jgi:hypothetical protein
VLLIVVERRFVKDVLEGLDELGQFGRGDGGENKERGARVKGGLTADLGKAGVEGRVV